MQFDKTLKIVICLLMIIPMLNISKASAASNYNHEELLEYEGYGEAMYESIVEQTTFISGSYTDNKQYVKDTIQEIKDYAKFWREELVDEENCRFDSTAFSCLGSMAERGGAYFLTVGDWVKNFFNDFFAQEDAPPGEGGVETNPYAPYFYPDTDRIRITNDYFFVINDNTTKSTYLGLGLYAPSNGSNGWYVRGYFHSESWSSNFKNVYFETEKEAQAYYEYLNISKNNVGVLLSLMAENEHEIRIYDKANLDVTPTPTPLPSRDNPIRDYINENDIEVPVPQPIPSLTCPNGVKIELSVHGSTFLDSKGNLMQVNKDGTAIVDGINCLLNWEVPPVDYIDGQPAMQDPDGKWLDLLTGLLMHCVITGNCKPSTNPGNETEIEPIDRSLLQYVKNAYEYATSTLKTATDGLKSLANGAKNLTNLFGTFFSWLPSEMIVLMSSGLGIAIGLRLFRK